MKSEENGERNSKIFYSIFSYIRYQNKKFSLFNWNVPFSITMYAHAGIVSQLLLQGSYERFGFAFIHLILRPSPKWCHTEEVFQLKAFESYQ